MIKKILSLFMAFTLCISTSNCEIFAGKSEFDHIPTKKNVRFKREVDRASIYAKQKAFLVVLLCTLGVDVYINFHNYYLSQKNSFDIIKIGNLKISDLSKMAKSRYQIPTLSNYLSTRKDLIDFETYLPKGFKGMLCARINNYILPQSTINKIGGKALELIEKKKSEIKRSHESLLIPNNLSDDTFFKHEITNLLDDILKKSDEKTNDFKFFTRAKAYSIKYITYIIITLYFIIDY